MPKFVSFVFKTIFLTVFIAMAVTLTACVVDVFITTRRIQNISEMMLYDVAQNNCMLNSTYKSYVNELYSISNRSRYMKVTYTARKPANYPNDAMLRNIEPVQLFVKGKPASTYFIQKDASRQTEGVLSKGTSAPASSKFSVAQYGTILHMRVNTVLNPWMFALTGTSLDTANRISLGERRLSLDFYVPALTYLK